MLSISLNLFERAHAQSSSLNLFERAHAQSSVTLYYDSAQQVPKETFEVAPDQPDVLHGAYTAYYADGSIKTKGQYVDNQAAGFWEYFYENGQPKMRGTLADNQNAGRWEYFYENGQLEMVGAVYDSTRRGPWRFYYESGQLKQAGTFERGQRIGSWQSYYEDGARKSQAEHRQDTTFYQEFYPSGTRKLKGIKVEGQSEGRWKHYYEDEQLQAEGVYQNGVRQGLWKFYYPNGQLSSVGDFLDGSSVGKWTYYYRNGTVSAEGAERDGVKVGYWKLYHSDGDFKGEAIFNQGDGTYREYYEDGSLRVKGQIVDGVNQGKWHYYYPDGAREGECVFQDGRGTYFGYYPDGQLKMKGTVDDGERTGVWELYKSNGKLVGYYESVYEDDQPAFQTLEKVTAREVTAEEDEGSDNPDYLFRKKKSLRYFEPKINERQRFILGINPTALLAHRLPLGFEYYLQERLGYEAEVGIFRDPFFVRNTDIARNTAYQRGFFVHVKQKFYHPDSRFGMFYFGHQLGLDYLYHYANLSEASSSGGPSGSPRTELLAKEQRISYALLVGTRLIKDGDLINARIVRDRHARGLTFDLFGGVGLGYRLQHPHYEPGSLGADVLGKNRRRAFIPFYFGATVGYAF